MANGYSLYNSFHFSWVCIFHKFDCFSLFPLPLAYLKPPSCLVFTLSMASFLVSLLSLLLFVNLCSTKQVEYLFKQNSDQATPLSKAHCWFSISLRVKADPLTVTWWAPHALVSYFLSDLSALLPPCSPLQTCWPCFRQAGLCLYVFSQSTQNFF